MSERVPQHSGIMYLYASVSRRLHSDADFEMILKQLKDEEAHKIRWTSNKSGVPDMIISERDRKFSFFDNTNGLVEDPKEAERVRKAANPWTEDEKKTFLTKFNKNPKRFYKISTFLPRKSVHDVIEYYYDNALTLDLKRSKPDKKAAAGGRLTIGGGARAGEDENARGGALWIWSEHEKSLFLEAIEEHGKDFAAIARYVGSKSQDKCKNFFNNNKKKLKLDELVDDCNRRKGGLCVVLWCAPYLYLYMYVCMYSLSKQAWSPPVVVAGHAREERIRQKSQ